MASELFKQYYRRVAKESWIKSLVTGAIVGFAAMMLAAIACWAFGFKHFWISFIVLVVVTLAVSPIFFFRLFKPTTREIAKRIDELGLEERMLTMNELEGDESFIAMKQREDALKSLETVNASLIKLIVSVPLIVAMAISGVFGLGMTTVSALSAFGVIKDGQSFLEELNPDSTGYFEIHYLVEGEGVIEGETDEGGPDQIVKKGEDAAPVIAIAMDGWAFVEWSDGMNDPYRHDIIIEGSLTVTAIFTELEDMDSLLMDGDGIEMDSAGDQPGKGEGGLMDAPGGEGESTQGGAGKYEPNNQIIDGKTYYGDALFDEMYEQAMNEVNNSEDLSEDKKDLVGDYLDTIEK